MARDAIEQLIHDYARSPQAAAVDTELIARVQKVDFAKVNERERELLTQTFLRYPNSRERLAIEEVLSKHG